MRKNGYGCPFGNILIFYLLATNKYGIVQLLPKKIRAIDICFCNLPYMANNTIRGTLHAKQHVVSMTTNQPTKLS